MFARVLEHTSEPADKPEAFRDYLGDNDPMADPKGTIPLPPRARLFTARQAIDVALESYRGSRLTEARGILQKVVDAEPGGTFGVEFGVVGGAAEGAAFDVAGAEGGAVGGGEDVVAVC